MGGLFGDVDDVLKQAAFERRHGVKVTDEQALAGHLAEALAELGSLRDEAKDLDEAQEAHKSEIEYDYKCSLSDTQREEGHTCDSARADDCLSCRVVAAKRALDCGRPDDDRVNDVGECRDTYGACAACRRADAYRDAEEERKVTQAEHEATIAKLEAASADDGDRPGLSGELDKARSEIVTLRANVQSLTDELETARIDLRAARADHVAPCGYTAEQRAEGARCGRCAACNEAAWSKTILLLGQEVERQKGIAEAMRVDRADVEARLATFDRVVADRDAQAHLVAVLTAERDRLILEIDAPKPKAAPAVKVAGKPGQAAIDFDAPAVAPAKPYELPSYLGHEPRIVKATLPARECGCGGKGAHRATCKLHKPPVRKTRLHLLPPGSS